MTGTFIHLRVHSEFSIVNSVIRLKPLMKAVAAAGMPAIALTDRVNLFGAVQYYQAAESAGVKPIIGVELLMSEAAAGAPVTNLILLAMNQTGYLNLTHLISRAYIEGQRLGLPLTDPAWLDGRTDGLIALSGGRGGEIGQALIKGDRVSARELLLRWCERFPDRFYVEVQRTGRPQEEVYLQRAVDLAIQCRVPVVATNDVHFLKAQDFEVHETRVCIAEGHVVDDPRRPRIYSEQQYLRTPAEMAVLFNDIPEALENSVEIAKRCNVRLTLGKPVLPAFPVPDGSAETDFLRSGARAGLAARLRTITPAAHVGGISAYESRLERELDCITSMGFSGYFLIVADFIQWARDNGIPVGPGRGSGAGSLVAYALGITDLDPLQYDLLFERFLNPERVSMPDFDVDFCMERRDEVIEYVVQRYGRERVSQIITYGTMAAKAVVRDVGRALGYPLGMVDKIAKLIPFELGITLDKALESEEMLRSRYEAEDDVRTLLDLGRALEGLTRNAGKHAGGVVIAPRALTDFTPLYCEEGSTATVTQFDKDDVEAVGLVKFDFLGLRTLTIIDWAVRNINHQRARSGEPAMQIEQLPLDDAQTYALLKNCATTAVFQLESRGMKDLIKRLQPDCFEEIIALVALFRPGPLQSGMVDDFINRKHGRTRVVYPHPSLEPILKPTYGVILYQEQVMQIAQVLAGYTLGGADLLRRAMGKKKPEEMAKQRGAFVEGAKARGVDEATSTYIFDLIEKFAGYGFNKSHSAAYALLSYQTAWLKAHYPAAFMAAVLTADMDNTDKIVGLIDECRDRKLVVVPPDVNASEAIFTVLEDGRIQYGLGAVKGVGEAALANIVDERKAHGVYRDVFDFCRRIDLRRVNRRMLEALIRSGALDRLGTNRATLMATLTTALQAAEQTTRAAVVGQEDLFGGMVAASPASMQSDVKCADLPEWPEEQRLQGEKETLGLYLTGHPIIRYEPELARFITARICDLRTDREQKVILAGLVMTVRTMNNRRGERIAFVILDDRSGRVELAVFADSYHKYRDILVKDRLLVVDGTAAVDEYTGGFKISADRIFDIAQARAVFAKKLVIDVRPNGRLPEPALVKELEHALLPFRDGPCPVWINYENGRARATVVLAREWSVQPSDECLARLADLLGDAHIRIEY